MKMLKDSWFMMFRNKITCFMVCLGLILGAGEVSYAGVWNPMNSAILHLMKKYGLPGGALAIMKDGRLAMANGYGWADQEKHSRAKPETLFRIASVSKTITGVAVLKLVQDGRIGLGEKVFEILDDYLPPEGTEIDPRIRDITVRHLLHHIGGWDPEKAGDPQFMTREIAEVWGLPSPVSPQTVIRYWIKQPLQFTPGTEYHYSNFGYNVLGRIIEKVTGQTYQDYANSTILMPLGIRRMQIGQSLREQRAKDEAAYYAPSGAPLVDSVFPVLGKVPQAYGGWSHPALDAHGGWIASVVDLLRFVRGVEGSGGQSSILNSETIKLMEEDPKLPNSNPNQYYGLGWRIKTDGKDVVQWSHTGALEGSNSALLVRQANGISYALIFNFLPADLPTMIVFFKELEETVENEIKRIRKWPPYDSFAAFP
jgi:N-acyl-D-amino-acid deacylase